MPSTRQEIIPELIVFSPHETPRLKYVLRILFEVLYPIRYTITQDPQVYQHFEGVCINYSTLFFSVQKLELRIPPNGLLAGQDFKPLVPVVCSGSSGYPGLFPVFEEGEWSFSFDLFSACFFLLSRYEEYQDVRLDQFGRMSAAQSLQAAWGMLEYPMVDLWAKALMDAIQRTWPRAVRVNRVYRFLPTYDVDIAWAYLNRPLWRQALGAARDLGTGNLRNLHNRLEVCFRSKEDPYYTFDLILNAHSKRSLQASFFFLVSNYRKHDEAISYKSPELQALICALAKQAEIGIHPSLASNQLNGRLQVEKSRLESILGKSVRLSRQHFLVLQFPETYRRLLDAGIGWDYSMGYADAPGFRAGISCAFPWFDLEKNEETALWIQPLQVMDVTLKQYLHLSPEEAVQKVSTIVHRIKEVGGEFCLLWHNSSFSSMEGWGGWEEAYLRILDISKPG